MKNILTAVFLIGFLSISTGVFAQHLRLLEKNLPCDEFLRLRWYKLYIEADAPDIPGVNTASIQIVSLPNYNVILGISGVGGSNGEKVPFAESPTGWAYCLRVKTSLPNYTQLPSFEIEETDTYNNRILKRTIEPKAKMTAAPISDLELVNSDLCNGSITLKVRTMSEVDGNEYSHEYYDWYYNNDPTPVATTTTNTATLNIGTAIVSLFDIKVVARNMEVFRPSPTVCSDADYTKSFDPVIGAIYNSSLIDASRYCRGIASTLFEINNPTPGAEYEWTFITTTTWETVSGLDMTKYYATFRSNDAFVYVLLKQRINCGAWTQVGQPIFNNPIVTESCGGSSRVVNNNLNHTSLLEGKLTIESGTTNEVINVIINNDRTDKLTTLDNRENAFTAFPNPTTDLLELNSESEKIESVNVYNVTGVLVAQKLNVNTTNSTLDLSKLPQGMYMVNIQTATTNKTIQVIKE